MVFRRDGGDGIEVIDDAQLILYDAGDLVLDIRRRRPRIHGDGADGRRLDLGEHIHREFDQRNGTEQHDPQKDHDGGYRSFDAELRKPHCPPL